MRKVLQAASTLTDRYQTTIPESVRDLLHLGKRDKITYTVEDNGKVLISRATEDDPVITNFLQFLTKDMKKNPANIKTLNSTLIDRARSLTSGVEIDLDAPLDDKDE